MAGSNAAVAHALAPSTASAGVVPAQAGAPATLAIQVIAREPRGAYPEALALSLPPGSRLDGRAAPRRCPRRAALADRCPRSSRIATGAAHLLQTATFAASDPGVPLSVEIGLFAAPTRRPGDLRGLWVISHEGVTQIGGLASGSVSRVGTGGGPQLNFGLGLVQRAPEESITFMDLSLALRAPRGRFPVFRNPGACLGSWAVGTALTGVEPVSTSVPCAAA